MSLAIIVRVMMRMISIVVKIGCVMVIIVVRMMMQSIKVIY